MNMKKWLKKATDNSGTRPDLGNIYYEDGLAIATDGYNLHITTTMDKCPDWRSLMEEIDPKKGIYFSIDAEKLIKAVEGMGAVTIHVSGTMKPVEISGNLNGDPFYAVVMPMKTGDGDHLKNKFWRPKLSAVLVDEDAA